VSHYTRVATTLHDPVILAGALAELGFAEVEVHDSPQPLRGWGRDGTERAEIIIRREHATGAHADIGFARGADGTFTAVMDAMDRHRYDSAWMTGLARAYGYTAALHYARGHGYVIVTDEAEQDGTRRLTLRRVS
jgi:hypothetical protein